MALIDVSELMSDPDFVDAISVITRYPTIDYLGQNHLAESSINSVGCVQPASYKEIQRVPEAQRVSDMSSFWFKGVITATAPGKYSSVLVFKGQRYQVLTVADWSNFGEGYTQGVCVAEKLG